MKIKVHLKDPDGVSESLDRGFVAAVGEEAPNLSTRETQRIADDWREAADDVLRRWIRYGEHVTIEIDTDDGTARVVPQ